jgi:hypothetical protein
MGVLKQMALTPSFIYEKDKKRLIDEREMTMKRLFMCLVVLAGIMFLSAGCESGGGSSTQVRFQNNSGNTVSAIWDGGRAATLAPGQTSDYQDANPGTHTIQWKDAANNNLTSVGWPNLVEGERYTFPY